MKKNSTGNTNNNPVTEPVKGIPYGLTDFRRIRTQNYCYIDKTIFLSALEKVGSYLFFIRPRRFGKSLFISMMEAYYDIEYKDNFEELFKGTAIYDNPTNERNSHLILVFDFSQVVSGSEKLENSFLWHVRGQVESFLKKYSAHLGKDGKVLLKRIFEIDSAADILSALSRLCRDLHLKTYVLIDEYDNFANTILSSTGTGAYHDLTHGEGFFRAFFNILKGGTSRMDAPFTRIFLTGVSPITMDDVTSGYNIGMNVSLDKDFNRMLGLTEEDIYTMIEYYRSKGLIKDSTPFLLDTLTRWYGNYLFSGDDDVKMYNSDMVLYFLKKYMSREKFPENLIDRNVRIDYGKLRYLIILEKESAMTTNGNFNRMKEIVERGETSGILQDGFPLEELSDADNFISLLFYFGLLTIRDIEMGDTVLSIPNETIRQLYYEYIKKGYEETGVFSLDFRKYRQLLKAMAYKGEWKSLLIYLTGLMKESSGLRDFIEGEKTVQAFLNVYLGLSNLYLIYTEKEVNKGYADIIMEPFLARYEGIKYSYIIELKYINKSKLKKDKITLDDRIKKLVIEAEAQLAQYSADNKLAKVLANTTLIKLVLVFCGHEAVYIEAAR